MDLHAASKESFWLAKKRRLFKYNTFQDNVKLKIVVPWEIPQTSLPPEEATMSRTEDVGEAQE
jgi:hypothetical protein